MSDNPVHAVARVSTPDGRPAGLAFQYAPGRFATCAHVVNKALGRERGTVAVPEGVLGLRLFDGTAVRAVATGWRPSGTWRDADDAAVLTVLDAVPETVPVLETGDPPGVAGVQVCGPSRDRDGTALDHVRGRLVGERSPGLWQLHQETGGPHRVRGGYSGGPVWTEDGRVVGLVRAARDGREHTDAECLAVDRLPRPVAGGAGDVRVLHVHGLRLDAATGPDRVAALLGSVAARVIEAGPPPDVVVFSGNLAASARPGEYALAGRLRADLRALFGLAPERVVTVPGPSDVSETACAAYFLDCEDAEIEPVWPYARKWGRYDAFDPLPPEAPWRWVEFAGLPLVVAGLNSTVHDTHLSREPGFGAEQTGWFRTRLRSVGANVHRLAVAAEFPAHDSTGDLAVDTRLSGVDFGYELHVFGRHDLASSRFRHDGTGFVAARPEMVELPSWEPAPEAQPTFRAVPDDMELVERALAFREPDARLVVHRERGYIQVVTTHDFGDGAVPTGGYVVGVGGREVSQSDVDALADGVLVRLRATGEDVHAQLVHFGDLPEPALVEYARRHRITLVSFRQFQFGWDPRAFVQWQDRRLAGDPRYPAHLYIPQRYRRVSATGGFDDGYGDPAPSHDLHRRIRSWLGDDAARLVVVLGSAGAGKTFLLRTLARRLSADDGPLTPVYLQLRELERVPNLDVYVAGRFADAQEHRIDMRRFNYYLEQGHIALLLDGLDELTVHGGYDRALGHLQAISEKVTGKAKVVITARDTEFLSNRHVLDALGGSGAALAGRRALHVEDFADDQVEEFLTRFLGTPVAARERLALLGSVGPLPEVARNPRMLSFIATLEPDRLRRAAERSGGEINSAELYRALLDQWMEEERKRLKRPGEKPALTTGELWAAVTKLAVYLWTTERESIAVEDLGAAADLLSHVDADARIRQVGSGSVLIRHEDGDLGFIHRSVQEWLVAKAAVADTALLTRHRLSDQAARFYAELGGEPADIVTGQVASQNAALIGDFQDTGAHFLVNEADMRGHDFSGDTLLSATFMDSDLTGANLAGHDLGVSQFVRTNLTGADLSGAKLGGTRFEGSVLDHASLLGTDVTPGQLTEAASLFGAALPGSPVTAQYRPWHLGTVYAMNPVRDLLATGDDHGWMRVIDPATSRVIKQWRAFSTRIDAVCWSPEGTLLAIGAEGVLRTCDPVSDRVLWQTAFDDERVDMVAWSRSGDIAVAVERGELYFVRDGVRHSTGLLVNGRTMRWSPDGITLAVPTPDAGAPSMERVLAIPGATAMAWSPDGHRIAYGDASGDLRLRDLRVPGETPIPSAHVGAIVSVDWSPDGERLLTSDRAGGVVETYVDDSGRRASYVSDSASLPAYTLAGAAILVGRREIRPMNRADGTARSAYSPAPVTEVWWSPGGELIASRHDLADLRLWSDGVSRRRRPGEAPWAESRERPDLSGLRPTHVRATRPSALTLLEPHVAAMGHGDGVIYILGRDSGDVIASHDLHDYAIAALDYSAKTRLAASADDSGTLKTWRRDGTVLRTWTAHDGPVTAMAFSPDGTRLLTGGADGLLRVWTPEGEHLTTLIALEEGSAAVHGDGRTFQLDGEPRGEFWYAAALARLDPETLARHTSEVIRLPRATPEVDEKGS